MFIQTEETPNPNSLKFIPGREVLGNRDTVFFLKTDSCDHSPFVRKLFGIDGIDSILLGQDFITISKNPDKDWYDLKPAILGTMLELFVNNLDIIIDKKPTETIDGSAPEEDSIIQQIQELLETRVRPAVAQDGGDIVFDSFKDGIVYVKMQGACSGCPSSTATLKAGIENMLRYYIPEVMEVQQVDYSK
ncbi:MAG: NifU family protein [Alphaproteobacteria bacterium]|nr:NifU family protein [Alphaproteobacteria bacterium]